MHGRWNDNDERFYSCEYAKSNRSECKYCEEKIDKGELRLAIHIQSKIFDGTSPTWYHLKCFFKKTTLLLSTRKLRGYESLRWSDQQKILEFFPNSKTTVSLDTQLDNITTLINPELLTLEYASNSRFKCQTCKAKLLKNTAIVSQKAKMNTKLSAKSHLDCFIKQEIKDKRINCQSEDISGFDSLNEIDKTKIKSFIESINKSNSKRKSELEDKENLAKKAKLSHEEQSKEQNERFWSIRDRVDLLKKNVIEDILKSNNQKIVTFKGHDEIVNFVTDMMCYAPLKPCPTCKGQLIPRSDKYSCTGNLSEFTKCSYVTQEPARSDTLIIYPDSRNKSEFLKEFKFKPQKKLFREPLVKSVVESIETKSTKNARQHVYQRMERDTSNIVGGGKVDPQSGLENIGHVLLDENEDHYSCALSIVSILSGKNTFYKMQIIKNNNCDVWNVYRSWGRLGTDIGDKKTTSYESIDKAIKEFLTIFKEKTGFEWKSRKTAQKQPNKFYFIDIEKCAVDRDLENKMLAVQTMCDKDFVSKSTLPVDVQNLVKLIFNVENMKYQMRRFKIDVDKMPLGKVSSNQIKKAYSILTDLTALLEKNGDPSLILDASNRFYSIIPHYFGTDSPTLIDDPKLIKEKLDMLDSLMEIEAACNLFKAKHENESKTIQEMDLIDFHYNQLECKIEPLDQNSDEFKLIKEYVTNTHSKEHNEYKIHLEGVFKLDRKGEAEFYSKYKSFDNKKLLFHGSRVTNFAGILSQGLKIAPKEAPSNGYMFGKGVYFADMVSKSANYCYPSNKNLDGLLLLCEVALGNMYERLAATGTSNLPPNKNSTFGKGKLIPDPGLSHFTKDNVEVPLGKPIENSKIKSQLIHNEFIVYDTAQINLKYLLKVKFEMTNDK